MKTTTEIKKTISVSVEDLAHLLGVKDPGHLTGVRWQNGSKWVFVEFTKTAIKHK